MARYVSRDLKIYNKFLKGCPIMLHKTRLLYDNETSDVILQVSLSNFSDKNIKSICFLGDLYDNEDRLILEKEKLVIKDEIKKGLEFSTNDPILIKENDAFHIMLLVYSVEFEDGSTWVNKGKKEGEDVLPKIYIEDKMLRDAFTWKNIDVKLDNYPIFTKDYYVCSCGKVHVSNTLKCDNCGIFHDDLKNIFDNKNIQRIIKEYKKSPEKLVDDTDKEFELPKDYTLGNSMNFIGIVLLIGGIVVLAYIIYSIIEKNII